MIGSKKCHQSVERVLPCRKKSLSVLFVEVMKWIDFAYQYFLRFDRKIEGQLSFFFRHFGKSRFMIAMSKKAQILGLESLFLKGPKAFFYFFLFYLVRDTILYIIIPVYVAKFID